MAFSSHHENEPSEISPKLIEVSLTQTNTETFVPDVATQEVSVVQGQSEVNPS
jgi:hypothetical protein